MFWVFFEVIKQRLNSGAERGFINFDNLATHSFCLSAGISIDFISQLLLISLGIFSRLTKDLLLLRGQLIPCFG